MLCTSGVQITDVGDFDRQSIRRQTGLDEGAQDDVEQVLLAKLCCRHTYGNFDM